MKVYNLFVASPGDVSKEREAVKRVTNRVNRTLGKTLDVMLRPFLWEHDAIPGFGKSAQSIITEQAIHGLKMDCAIFILWHRYGTPVDGYSSGWQAEFQEFVKQHQENPNFKILFFSKTKKIKPREIDARQLDDINQFLAGLDGLYASFSRIDEFEEKLEAALTHALTTFELQRKKNRKSLD